MNKDTVVARITLVEEEPPLGGCREFVPSVRVINNNLYDALVGKLTLVEFLNSRKAPQKRANIKALFGHLGFHRISSYLRVSLGLSMVDCAWVREAGSTLRWADVNLFDNAFNDVVAQYAFNGVGVPDAEFNTTSPEYSTDGALPKMWKRHADGPHLYKGGTSLGVNSGMEPYAEFYASHVAARLGLHAYVPYDLKMHSGVPVSDCRIFTSKSIGYISMSRLLAVKGVPAEDWQYWLQAHSFLEQFKDILLFDCVVCNPDRHLGNFGVLVDTDTYTPLQLAPIFDNGMSLAYDWYADNYERLTPIEWVNRSTPCNMGKSYVECGRSVLDAKRRHAVERLRGWAIPRHITYDWSNSKCRAMNELLQHQVEEILR